MAHDLLTLPADEFKPHVRVCPASDVESLVMQLAQEVTALRSDLAESLSLVFAHGYEVNERYGRYVELCGIAGVKP